MKKAIHTTDVVFATVRQCGRTLAHLCLVGLESMAQVMARVLDALGNDGRGPVTVLVRNSSQGWTESRMLRQRQGLSISGL